MTTKQIEYKTKTFPVIQDDNRTKCNECENETGHAIWCSLSKHAINKALAAGTWIAVSEHGVEKQFMLAPSATEQFAFDYAKRNVTFIAGDYLASVRKS